MEELVEFAFVTSTVEPKSMKDAQTWDDWNLWYDTAGVYSNAGS